MENNINQTPENNNQHYNTNYNSEYGFTGKTLFFLSESGKWSKYYSLCTIILFGIAIALILISATSVAMSVPNIGIYAALLMATFCVLLLAGVIPMWFLLRASNKIKDGLHNEFLPDLLKGIDEITRFFKASSIYVAIMLTIMIIAFCLFLVFQGSISSMINSMKPTV